MYIICVGGKTGENLFYPLFPFNEYFIVNVKKFLSFNTLQ